MSNLSYCRFQNTLKDLRDCDEHLWDDDLSKEEERARNALVNLCRIIAENFDTDDEEGD